RKLPGTNISYLPGYTPSSWLSSSPAITFDSQTGDITLNATSTETSIMAVLVKEYRNGVLIGSVVRDAQVWAMPCNNILPTATGINGTTNFSIDACAGLPINFFINSFDADAGQVVTMTCNNDIPSASFT